MGIIKNKLCVCFCIFSQVLKPAGEGLQTGTLFYFSSYLLASCFCATPSFPSATMFRIYRFLKSSDRLSLISDMLLSIPPKQQNFYASVTALNSHPLRDYLRGPKQLFPFTSSPMLTSLSHIEGNGFSFLPFSLFL